MQQMQQPEENLQPIQIYQDILGNSFEKIKKNLPKKYLGVKDLVQKMQNHVMQDPAHKLDANRYFIIYKLAINTKQPKLIEVSLKAIQQLISYNFLNGNCPDYTLEVNLEEFKDLHDPFPLRDQLNTRKLISTIMDMMVSLTNEKDENHQMLVIKIFVLLATHIHTEMHGIHISAAIQTIIIYYSQTRNSQVEKLAKQALQQIINYNYQKLSLIEGEKIKKQLFGNGFFIGNAQQLQQQRERGRTTQDQSVIQKERSPSPNQTNMTKQLISIRGDTTLMQQNQLNQKELSPINNILKSQEDAQDADMSGYFDGVNSFSKNQNFMFQGIRKNNDKNQPTFDTICLDTLINIVDDVCIYEARKDAIVEKINQDENIPSDQKQNYIQVELQNIPTRVVPTQLDPNDPQYYRVLPINSDQLVNENDQPAGLFGWCSKCRNTANYYCKDLRVPVCSIECKISYQQMNEAVNKRFYDYQKNSKIAFEDCLSILQSLSYLLIAPSEQVLGISTSSLENAKSSVRLKVITLEMIYAIFDLRDSTFFRKEQAIKVIKEKLFDGILKCCLNNEKSIFSLSFGIFLQLLIYHKEEFKNEISIFINEIFLQLLESPNSSSNHRHLALQVLNKAFQKTRVVLDFYVNYDCSFNQVQLVDRIVSILSKIATGLYSRPEFQMMIQPNQELLLRQYAVETLALMMRSIYEYFDNYTQQQDSQNQNQINGQSKNDVLNGGKNLDETTIMQIEENREIIKIDLNDHQNQIEKEHIIKIETQRAIQKFNKKPSLGIKHLIQTGIIQPDDAVGIAKFLIENPSISKDQIGEYIGGHHELNINVLSEFTDLINFQDRRIDVAMRQYLETFTLPGEAQIVDRILQKFGDKFQRDNPQTFQSAGGAYTLSFLLIMLQTDMYNPQVKDKMKLEDFIKIAKNIEGEHFETDYLTELYRSIQKEPLALHEKAKTVKNLQDSISTTMRKKQDLFLQETQKMIEKGKNLISEKNKLSSKFIKANSMYYIGPLVETIGPKILSAFKHALENCDDDKTVRFSLEGFNSTILLSCHFNLEQERNSFVEALCQQSNLENFPNSFKKKNYSVIKQVLHLSQKIGNSLHQSWLPILTLISKLNENRLIQNGADKRPSGSGRRPSSLVLTDSEWSLQQSYVESDYIDRIYAKSTQLDGESIQDFITALCQVSKDELTSKSQTPRIFSLQKIVEIAELNMDRVVIVWNRIWAIIRDHFAEAGCHQNPQIAILAVDSLKQLSQKFFIKEERFNQQFQRDFLKPFEIIFQNVPIQNLFIKDFILDCFKNFLGNKTIYKKIKSGWRIIFNILGFALLEESDELSRNAYNIIKGIMEENLDTIHDVFVDLVQCLNKLSKKRQEDLALASIELVQKCLYYLADKSHVVPKSKLSFSSLQSQSSDPNINSQTGEHSNTHQTNKKSNESYWVPLLGVLSNLCGDHRPEIQEKSMESLFNILTEYGYTFSIEFWKMIFQGVLRPLFDEIQFTFQTKSQKQLNNTQNNRKFNWLKQSCNKAFHHITNLLFDYYDELQSLVIEFIKTYENCINNTNEQLIKQSVTAAKNTIIQLGPKFKSEDWDMIIGFFERMIRLTTPQKLLSINSDENGQKIAQDVKGKRKESLMYFYNQKINFDDANAQSKAQLLLIKVIQDVINSFQDKLSSNQLDNLCNILDKSYLFAIEFNSQIFLRYCLWKTGFNPELKQLPGILRQERQAQAMSLYIKYTHYRKQMKSGSCFNYNDLIDKLVEYMTLFLKKHKDLLKIIESEREKRNTDERSYYDSYERLDVPDLNEETIDLVVHKIKLTEVERDVNNHRTMISETVLPILEKIDLSHMKERVKEIYCILIDMTQYSQNRSFSQMVCQLCKNCSRCQNLDEDLDIFIRKILKKLFKFICDNPLPAQAPVAQVVLEQSALLKSVNQNPIIIANQENDNDKQLNNQQITNQKSINSDYVKITNSSSSIPEVTNEINAEIDEVQNENDKQKVNIIRSEQHYQDDSDNQLKIEKNLIKQVAGDYDEDDLNGSGNKNLNQNNQININSNDNSKSNSENNIDQNQQSK
ncbi:guanine nucleotide exchange factor (macronuclear) [Tetrahymena thermophila SB210]|uniref:Guanine nucleotide exchange factor n=2 Tax=Tetrahymena thermophila TaxID=5911 RepID=Q24I26_TETTS|nr:guanine nucleotide exchange factor [Tetrahymena thermophila SB210]AAU94929.1 guanine nucleotide exchange factor [Tetrahymena thermophila]EAS07412.2 guanine nucleotide exchange factor [Tetrahymena thermophila SB210]|eukprot:XP_001027654.2 guanine nucleotide exchange factor [Tetrahymena thermophila SB210]